MTSLPSNYTQGSPTTTTSPLQNQSPTTWSPQTPEEWEMEDDDDDEGRDTAGEDLKGLIKYLLAGEFWSSYCRGDACGQQMGYPWSCGTNEASWRHLQS